MSNDALASSAAARLKRANMSYDSAHSGATVGTRKPGGAIVADFCAVHNLEPHQTLVLGKDRVGVLEAMNGRAMGFHATWAGESKYGIKVDEPAEFFEYLDIFFSKKHLWYAKFDGEDRNRNAVHLRSLIDGNGAGDSAIKTALYALLKDRIEQTWHGASLSKVLMMHLTASCYLDGFLSEVRSQVIFQIYPGHDPRSQPPLIINAIISNFTLFRTDKISNSLVRHRTAIRSHKARLQGAKYSVTFANQLQTVVLKNADKVSGKHVFVIDDFITKGYSLEASRTLLQLAGATKIVGIAVGKYGPSFDMQSAKQPVQRWDPSQVAPVTENDFSGTTTLMDIDNEALAEFLESGALIGASRIGPKLHPR